MTFSKTQTTTDFDYLKFLLQLNGKFSFFNKHRNQIPDVINPFIYSWNIPWYQWLKMVIVTITIMPIRIFGFLISFGISYLISFIALYGQRDNDFRFPMSGWRKNIALPLFLLFARTSYFFGSIHWIKVKGRRSTSKEAPILVLGPHSAFMDSLFVVFLGMNSVIGKTETANSTVGYLLKMTQPILVTREDPNSRQTTIDEIKRRCHCKESWPQMLIFPEGTCTNRSCLINFKTGAFIPGCPIQPVVLRWPNKVDSITWTWDGPGVWTLLWMLFAQFHTFVEIEFLPIYHPSEEEKRNPKLFADNVRAVMAKALNVPTTNHSYEDCRHMTLSKKHGLPFTEIIVEFSRLQKRLLYVRHDSISMLDWLLDALHRITGDGMVSIQELCHHIYMTDNEALVERIFKFYDKNNSGLMDIKHLFCHLSLYSLPFNRKLAIEYIMKAYKTSDQMDNSVISEILQKSFTLSSEEANEILSFTKSHQTQNQSFLNILDAIMNSVAGPFNMYSDYHTEYNKSIKSGTTTSCALGQLHSVNKVSNNTTTTTTTAAATIAAAATYDSYSKYQIDMQLSPHQLDRLKIE